jgi:hypothetical protein
MKYLLIVVLLVCTLQVKMIRKFNFQNKCSQSVWVGGFGVPLPASTGW